MPQRRCLGLDRLVRNQTPSTRHVFIPTAGHPRSMRQSAMARLTLFVAFYAAHQHRNTGKKSLRWLTIVETLSQTIHSRKNDMPIYLSTPRRGLSEVELSMRPLRTRRQIRFDGRAVGFGEESLVRLASMGGVSLSLFPSSCPCRRARV
jgi:hypothetical protein